MKCSKQLSALAIVLSVATSHLYASSRPIRGRSGMVVSEKRLASEAGLSVLRAGGNAVDAAVATGLALAVTRPGAGNIGGGGFMVFRAANGEASAYDFREKAPAVTTADLFMKDGKYSRDLHYRSGRTVGIPGTVSGFYLAWQEHGKLPWSQVVAPAIALARDGIPVTVDFEGQLMGIRSRWKDHAGTLAQYTKNGEPYRAGDILKQPDLADTLERIAENGAAGFYEGETARLIVEEMKRIDGLITLDDLKGEQAVKRTAIRGTYRGYEIITMPPPSTGGTAIVEMLNILEGFDMNAMGMHSAASIHVMVEAMRRGFADRARFMGDPDFNPGIPVERLTSKEYANQLRTTINLDRASTSSTTGFELPSESPETTAYSVVDGERNAVSVIYTLGRSMSVVTGAGFQLNTELGDFHGSPDAYNVGENGWEGRTQTNLIGIERNLPAPGKRPMSSMTPTIVAKDGELFMVTGTPGGRTIISGVVQTILHAVDYGLNAQDVVDAGRFHHQWLPDRIRIEDNAFSRDTLDLLRVRGHTLELTDRLSQCFQVIIYNPEEKIFEGGSDLRRQFGGVATY